MPTRLHDFRAELQERLLDLLWRQWSTIGVSGHGSTWSGSVIDPDALLLVSCTIARYDARLFDAMLEWLRLNGRFINIHRVKRMLKDEAFAGEGVLRAVAAATSTSADQAKWARLVRAPTVPSTNLEPLFFLMNGAPLPVVREEDPLFASYGFSRDHFEARGVAETFRPEPVSNLLLRLRALLGVNARCEIFQFLLVNGSGSPRSMASDCYYFPATINKAMTEMSQSGFLVSRVDGRRRIHRLVPDAWTSLLLGNDVRLTWVVWARLFSALEQIWLFLLRDDLADQSSLAQASSLRRILKRAVVPQLEGSVPGFMFGDDSAHPGEGLIPFFIARIRSALESVVSQPAGG